MAPPSSSSSSNKKENEMISNKALAISIILVGGAVLGLVAAKLAIAHEKEEEPSIEELKAKIEETRQIERASLQGEGVSDLFSVPFVEAAGRNHSPVMTDARLEGFFLEDSLGAGVDQDRLLPAGRKSPPFQGEQDPFL
jgi:hypothetical protein